MPELIFYDKFETFEGNIVEQIIWKVQKSKEFPYGIKYRFVYVHKGKRILGYDNEKAKGDHKHYLDKEYEYKFMSVQKLNQDFLFDVLKIRRILYGNKES